MTEGQAADEEEEDVESGPPPIVGGLGRATEADGGEVAEEGETRLRMV